jgi:hypothetical protein
MTRFYIDLLVSENAGDGWYVIDRKAPQWLDVVARFSDIQDATNYIQWRNGDDYRQNLERVEAPPTCPV